jgi:hypothetical protein
MIVPQRSAKRYRMAATPDRSTTQSNSPSRKRAQVQVQVPQTKQPSAMLSFGTCDGISRSTSWGRSPCCRQHHKHRFYQPVLQFVPSSRWRFPFRKTEGKASNLRGGNRDRPSKLAPGRKQAREQPTPVRYRLVRIVGTNACKRRDPANKTAREISTI